MTDTIRELLLREGDIVGDHQDYDVLVMNGEGTMHHGAKGFMAKMQALRAAQAEGHATYLINSLWQENPSLYDTTLRRLDGLSVRGAVSQRDMAQRHGIGAAAAIDLSYYAPVDETAPFTDLGGGVAVTDLWMEGFGFVWMNEQTTAGWHRIDMQTMSWSSLVRTLRTASAVVAGRHHAIYAACVAGTPFVALKHNSHKVADLLEMARAPIPICLTRSEVTRILHWSQTNRAAFDALFDWMKQARPPATLADAGPPPGAPLRKFIPAYGPRKMAVMANLRGDDAAAALCWEAAPATAADRLTMQVNAGNAWLRAGYLERGAAILFAVRQEDPARRGATRGIRYHFLREEFWQKPAPPDAWTSWARAAWLAVAAAAAQDDAGFETLAAQALQGAAAESVLVRHAARLLIALRLTRATRQRLATAWWTATTDPACPVWMEAEDTLFVLKHTGDLTRLDTGLTRQLAALPTWHTLPDLRELYLDAMWQRRGATTLLVAEAKAAHADFPADVGIFEMCCMIYHAAGDIPALADIMLSNPAAGRVLAAKCAPIAAWLVQTGADMDDATRTLAAFDLACVATRRDLFARLAQSDRHIAIVGNGPGEIGRGLGADIDRHDDVVRFNTFRLGGALADDYGTKTTIVASVFSMAGLLGYLGVLPAGATLVLYADRARYLEANLSVVQQLAEVGITVCHAPDAVRARLVAEFDIIPTTGCLFAADVRLHRHRPDVDFYGFHLGRQEDVRYHYYGNQRGYETHDWAVEARIFRDHILAPAGQSVFQTRSDMLPDR